MFKKTITFVNGITDESETETLYFNLTTPEVAEFGFDMEEDAEAQIRDMVEKDDRRKMFMFFKLIMAHSYGRRTPDGKGFAKKKEWLDELFSGFAYEELFIWLFSDPDNAAAFFNAVMPNKNIERLNEAQKTTGGVGVERETKPNPRTMSREDLEAAYLARMGKTPVEVVLPQV